MPPFRTTALVAATLLGLAGCAGSPPIQYHALSGAPATEGPAGGAAVLVELLPVAIPQRLNRDEIVLSGPEGRPLDIRETHHWAAPLSDEIRQILDEAMWRRLRAADVYRAPVAPGMTPLPQYRVAVRLERLDATPGAQAVAEVSWTARRLPSGAPAACRASRIVALPDRTIEAAVTALASGISQLAAIVAASLDAMNQGEGDPCAAAEDGAGPGG